MLDLSIIVPIYNGEKYIDSCLEQILKNKNANFEVILLNDGSKDSTDIICKKHEELDKRIKYIKKENSGVSDTRNLGISIAKGKWMMFVDCDDLLVDDWYKIICNFFKEKKDLLIFTSREKSNISNEVLLDCIFNVKKETFLSAPVSKLYNTDFIKNNNIYFIKNVINGEDMLFNATTLTKNFSFKIIEKGIYKYRMAQGSATKRFDKQIFQSDRLFHKELENIAKNNNINLSKYIKYSKMNALYMFVSRLSYLKIKEARLYYKEISSSYYEIDDFKFELSFKTFCTILIKHKIITPVLLMIKLRKKIATFKENKKEYFIDL